jgi:hypothetical protein
MQCYLSFKIVSKKLNITIEELYDKIIADEFTFDFFMEMSQELRVYQKEAVALTEEQLYEQAQAMHKKIMAILEE